MKQMTSRLLLCVFAALLSAEPVFSQDLVIYTKSGCPFCDQALEFLEDLEEQHPGFEYEERDISQDPEALSAYVELIEQYAIEIPAVPLLLVKGRVFIGYRAPETPRAITDLFDWQYTDIPRRDFAPTRSLPDWLSVERYELPTFTVILGLLDGFNPCAMWVLMFLLSMLTHIKNRQRMFLIAAVFVLISGLIYFLFMAAWLNLYLAFRWSAMLRVLIGSLGLVAAGFHLKDFFFHLKGPSLSISAQGKTRLGARVRSVITARNLPLAIIAVSVLAILVNFYELLCTAGIPALYTQVLVNQDIEGLRFYAFLLLYNAAYIFDDSLMVFSATWALSSKRLKPATGRVLKGISGLVLLLLSLLLIFKPGYLSFTP